MTAITLNLLAEEQLAEKAEARDPFKVALAIGIGVFALTVLVGTVLARYADKQKARADDLQTKWDVLTSTQGAVAGTDLKSLRSQVDDIVAISNGRQLFAPQMAFVKELVPDSIQLGHIDLKLSVELQNAPAPDIAGGEDKAKPVRGARPKNVERMTLGLAGRAISARPEIEVDLFIKSLRSNAAFNEQLRDVKLRSIARASGSSDASSSAASAPVADFIIECQYKERK